MHLILNDGLIFDGHHLGPARQSKMAEAYVPIAIRVGFFWSPTCSLSFVLLR